MELKKSIRLIAMKNKNIPMRTCVGCRKVRPKDELVRIVDSPDGLRIDPSGKLNGRGVYVCPNSYLGFAKKSGNLITGSHTCSMAAKKGRIKLMIISCDTSPGSIKKAVKMANDNNIRYRIFGNSDELSRITGTVSRNIFGITDADFADVIIKKIDNTEEVSQ